MTRTYARPVEEVARVLAGHMDNFWANGPMQRPEPGSAAFPDDFSRVEQAAIRVAAHAAAKRLRELGFISDLGCAALAAERDVAGCP